MIAELEQLKKFLWDSWDPIGVNKTDCPNDEYDSYALRIFSLLNNGADHREIADYLDWAVTENMGLDGNRNANAEIAQVILKIHEETRK